MHILMTNEFKRRKLSKKNLAISVFCSNHTARIIVLSQLARFIEGHVIGVPTILGVPLVGAFSPRKIFKTINY